VKQQQKQQSLLKERSELRKREAAKKCEFMIREIDPARNEVPGESEQVHIKWIVQASDGRSKP
jgi:hypothetical protein